MTQDPTGTGAGAAPGDAQPAGDRQARQRVVDRGVARFVALLAQAAVALQHDGLARSQPQFERERLALRRQHQRQEAVAVGRRPRRPVAAVHGERRVRAAAADHARDAGRGAAQPFVGEEATALDIGDRRVRQDHLAGSQGCGPRRGVGPRRGERLTEEHQLDAEASSRGGVEVGGHVPPFGAELGMRPVVARELQRRGAQRARKAGGRRRVAAEHGRQAEARRGRWPGDFAARRRRQQAEAA